MAYLDDTGLAYFWGKIKTWANSVFALLGHTHPASDVTLMTGYSKPASGSAIAASDSLNQAVGKLEAKVDDALDDSDYVHKTGDELVQGIKTFSNDHSWRSDTDDHLSSIQLQSPVLDRTVDPESSIYMGLEFLDKNSSIDLDYTSRLGGVELGKYPESLDLEAAKCSIYLKLYDPTTTTRSARTFGIGYDFGNRFYASAPSTSELRTSGTDILTRDWIPKDTRIVHTTGNEDIYGVKKFFDRDLRIKSNTIEKGVVPSENAYITIPFLDKNGLWIGLVDFVQRSSGAYDLKIGCYNQVSDHLVCLYCGTDENGIDYTQAASTSTSRNSGTDILTRDWIPKDTRIVHTTGSETIGGTKTFSATMKLAYTTVTRGTNPDSKLFRALRIVDTNDEYIGNFGISVDTNGTVTSYFNAYNFVSGSSEAGEIGIRYPKNGTPYTYCITPPANDDSDKIVTTEWSRDNLVSLSDTQSISGAKTFEQSITIERSNPYLFFVETDQTRWSPSGTSYQGLYFRDKNSDNLAQITILNYTNWASMRFMTYANKGTTTDDSYLAIGGGDGSNVKYFAPFGTKTFSLGNYNHLFTDIYCNNAAINTSDEKAKTSISEIPDEVLDAWGDVSFLSFQFIDAVEKKGVSARLHSGLVSQRVDAAFKARGIDGFRWGFLCRDQGDAVDRDEKQPDGTIRHFHEDAFDNWGVRYTEALCVEAAYMRRENARLKKRVADLEERLAALELKIS